MRPVAARLVEDLAAMVLAADTAGVARAAWVVDPFVVLPAPASRGVREGEDMPYRVDLSSVVVGGPGTVTARARGPRVDRLVELTARCVDPRRAADAGEAARWDLFELVEPMAVAAVARAHDRRVAEVASATGREPVPLADDIALEAVVNRMMTAPGGSFERITRLVLSPSRFHRVGPARWLRATVAREAWQEVGRAIGDVRPGPRLRLLAQTMSGASHAEVAAAYSATVAPVNAVSADLVDRALALRWRPSLTLPLEAAEP